MGHFPLDPQHDVEQKLHFPPVQLGLPLLCLSSPASCIALPAVPVLAAKAFLLDRKLVATITETRDSPLDSVVVSLVDLLDKAVLAEDGAVVVGPVAVEAEEC